MLQVPEAELSMTEGAFMAEQYGQNARYAGDKNLFVQFHILPVPRQDDEARKSPYPLFRDVEHVRIMQPGNKDSIIDRPVTDEDKRRFGDRYQAWQRGQTDLVEGTLLEAVARDPLMQISPSQLAELQFFNVRTVQQLATISDSNCQGHMGLLELRKRARAYLEAKEEQADTVRLQAELEDSRNEVGALKEAMADLQRQMAELKAAEPPKRGPGRPRKQTFEVTDG